LAYMFTALLRNGPESFQQHFLGVSRFSSVCFYLRFETARRMINRCWHLTWSQRGAHQYPKAGFRKACPTLRRTSFGRSFKVGFNVDSTLMLLRPTELVEENGADAGQCR